MPDLLSRLLLARPSIRRCAAAADALFAGGGVDPHLLVFDGERSCAVVHDAAAICGREPELLTLQHASELPWRRRIVGWVVAAIGLVATTITALNFETLLDLVMAALGGLLTLVGLWIAGLLPQVIVSPVAAPGRITLHGIWGSRSFDAGRDAAYLLHWGQSGGWEIVLVSPTGCVRSVWISDRQLPLLRSYWRL